MLKKINVFRKGMMNLLTKNIGISSPPGSLANKPFKKVLVIRPNHRLGNQLLISSLIQEIENTFENCEIDLFLKGNVGKIIYSNYPSVTGFICLPKDHFKKIGNYLSSWVKLRNKKYDLVINTVPESSSGRLATRFANSTYKIYDPEILTGRAVPKDYFHIAKKPVYNLREQTGVSFSKPIPKLNLKLTDAEIAKGKVLLQDLFNNQKETIAFFTFATGGKCYSKSWWHETYQFLKEEFQGEFNLLEILPKENVSQIDFKAKTFYSEDLREIPAVIENTSIFIAADSGVMHLASCTNTPVVGLFSVTDSKVYGPYGASNIAINPFTNKEALKTQIPVLLKKPLSSLYQN
ncbi:ADP-heptose--LPS heptosyltransferase [Christiangramia fulva]|uniref:ADP-heptose--LPS heptosyltransferase n=1 Tax=Christiangramia fulva TaxID=2126553 RepID=A0A2R3Z2X5_9FLAO|nr:glycosyltransferase family 9 protein [Christiangramia fulva]AVR44614.1 ADP-heptose--LPS heptosyltransferase [Christiangramia fulva]